MRYPFWHRLIKRGEPTPSAYDFAKKLLGFLSRRRDLSNGVETLQKEVTLPDGTIVRAAFFGGQPQVTIIPPPGTDEGETCSLYLETGVVDLGTPTAYSYLQTPIFDSSKPTVRTLGVFDCDDFESAPPVGTTTVRTLPLGAYGRCYDTDAYESRSFEPVTEGPVACDTASKKNAQARLPAGMWTGLMKRFVQALYGTNNRAYAVSSTASAVYLKRNWIIGLPSVAYSDAAWANLRIAAGESTYDLRWGYEPGDGNGTDGIVRIENRYYFARINSASVKLRPVAFSTCAAALVQALPAFPEAVRNEFLSVAFTRATIGSEEGEAEVEFDTPVEGLPPCVYGWAFSDDGSKAALATFDKDANLARVYEVAFGKEDGEITATLSILSTESADLYNGSTSVPRVFGPSPDALAMLPMLESVEPMYNAHESPSPTTFDAPVRVWYDADGTLVSTNVTLSAYSVSLSEGEDDCVALNDEDNVWSAASQTDKCGSWYKRKYAIAANGVHTSLFSDVVVENHFDEDEPLVIGTFSGISFDASQSVEYQDDYDDVTQTYPYETFFSTRGGTYSSVTPNGSCGACTNGTFSSDPAVGAYGWDMSCSDLSLSYKIANVKRFRTTVGVYTAAGAIVAAPLGCAEGAYVSRVSYTDLKEIMSGFQTQRPVYDYTYAEQSCTFSPNPEVDDEDRDPKPDDKTWEESANIFCSGVSSPTGPVEGAGLVCGTEEMSVVFLLRDGSAVTAEPYEGSIRYGSGLPLPEHVTPCFSGFSSVSDSSSGTHSPILYNSTDPLPAYIRRRRYTTRFVAWHARSSQRGAYAAVRDLRTAYTESIVSSSPPTGEGYAPEIVIRADGLPALSGPYLSFIGWA